MHEVLEWFTSIYLHANLFLELTTRNSKLCDLNRQQLVVVKKLRTCFKVVKIIKMLMWV